MKVYVFRFYTDTIGVAVHGINHMLTVAEAKELRDRLTATLNGAGEVQEHKGLYGKYIIEKADGTPVDPDAFYFVLRCDKDRHALPALEAYAMSCQADDAQLAQQLMNYVRGHTHA